MLIFIFLAAESAKSRRFACAKRTRKRKRQREGQEDGGGCAGGWQSVEASGADQWPDGGNSGILTLQPAKGAAAGAADAAAAAAGGAGAGAGAAASWSRYTVCGAACTQRQRMLVTRMAADREEEVEQERKSPRRC